MTYDKFPTQQVPGFTAVAGWPAVVTRLQALIEAAQSSASDAASDAASTVPPTTAPAAAPRRVVVAIACYPGVDQAELARALGGLGAELVAADDCFVSDAAYQALIAPFLTDDRVFGIMNTLTLNQVLDPEKTAALRARIAASAAPVTVVYGVGASLVCDADVLVYCDLPRWEIQQRYQAGGANWKTANGDGDQLRKVKQGYFVEWRLADRLKATLLPHVDAVIDTTIEGAPRLVSGAGLRAGLALLARRPFRLKPYFAPGVWGGQWMREHFALDGDVPNYAWAFDGVPEENSLLLDFGGVTLELPALDLVMAHPERLLGVRVASRFGAEFPIRFDFLDTMGGQNLSLQVHPRTQYIKDHYGMAYTQDESYYIMAAKPGAKVYLGLKNGADPAAMVAALAAADAGGPAFDAEAYVAQWPVHPHDHFLIPAGTVHCSGQDTVVLEVSATPYLFTYKLWDWGRLGLDGRPRPVHIADGAQNIAWDRREDAVNANLINQVTVEQDDLNVKKETTGLAKQEFIQTTRYWLKTRAGAVVAENDSVHMGNVVEGSGAIVSSSADAFAPYRVHYGETFIVPAAAGDFRLTPLDESCAVLVACVRE
ncbi:class I mannose-6-phosphate isomerase [Lacticaseibacillus kribbianus]|uniref:class I mannose-6-phosphate isomerase n=1 Tax=Lacticaseibacillus kribbianus TaxID=2926292 RepID=UPI001CD77E83|nr:class I mannose-6-phosphate isomerase [Lacticaseibacillus kribbianus]